MKFIAALLVAFVGASSACDFPPSLWCSSKEISKLCKVEDQCRDHLTLRDAAPLVNFGFYYESLCPFCKMFFKNNIGPAYNAIGNIMNITLVPYGNAEERKRGDKYVFTCQHGEQECVGNVIETCAIHLLKDIKVYFPFITCMEASSTDPKEAAKQCATKTKITQLNAIMKCADGPQGNQLEHQMAMKTDALQPAHQYVPWVTLNGVHTEKIQNEAEKNLLKLICDTYKGTKPAICKTEEPKKRCTKESWFFASLPSFGKRTHDVL
ncbi:gamma-interferon-inducible lysosomal thiol reductase-like isoform X2 [Lineus longissimus]|uniref:gamma-interferon-inducible lysosomal thiol reductase-like isoform X2 n=1 Tax=Lineus longissimus TaxID=88925 RepID=UPI002B4D1A62